MACTNAGTSPLTQQKNAVSPDGAQDPGAGRRPLDPVCYPSGAPRRTQPRERGHGDLVDFVSRTKCRLLGLSGGRGDALRVPPLGPHLGERARARARAWAGASAMSRGKAHSEVRLSSRGGPRPCVDRVPYPHASRVTGACHWAGRSGVGRGAVGPSATGAAGGRARGARGRTAGDERSSAAAGAGDTSRGTGRQ